MSQARLGSIERHRVGAPAIHLAPYPCLYPPSALVASPSHVSLPRPVPVVCQAPTRSSCATP
jgi:hypothetical protein